MFYDTTFPPPDGRLAQFERMLKAFERNEVELAVDLLIARLDAEDGDSDLEDSDFDAGIEDGPFDGDTDREGSDRPEWPGGCEIDLRPDEYEEDLGDAAARRPFRDMIRRRSCDIVTRNGRPWADIQAAPTACEHPRARWRWVSPRT